MARRTVRLRHFAYPRRFGPTRMSLFTSFRYLVALHELRHFGRAAQACHITQPAFSNAIRALEKEFGTAIVKRGRTFQSFTPEGERIFATAQRVLHEQELLSQDLRSAAGKPFGHLTLGAVPSVMPIAARFVGLLTARHAGLSLTLRSMSSADIESGVENLSLDLALGYTDRIATREVKISCLPQYSERYFLLRRGSSAVGCELHIVERPVSWAAAAQHRLCLLTPEMHNRTLVDEAFQLAGVPKVQAVIETNSILTLGLSVLVGDVCSVLPGALVGVLRGYRELEAVPLQAPLLQTPIGFMYADTDRPSHALQAALQLAAQPDWLQQARLHCGTLQQDPPGDAPT